MDSEAILRREILFGWTMVYPDRVMINDDTVRFNALPGVVKRACGYCLTPHDSEKCPSCGAPGIA